MKKNQVTIGTLYHAKVSNRIVEVRIDSTNTHGGWNATNTATGKRVHIKSAQRLRSAVRATSAQPEPSAEAAVAVAEAPAPRAKKTRKAQADTPKRLGLLSAAAQVLKDSGQAMRAKELIEAVAERGLWASPAGKTPEATLYAAMIREIATKGAAARFARASEKGLFISNN